MQSFEASTTISARGLPSDRLVDADTTPSNDCMTADVAEIVYNNSPSQIQRQDGDYQVSVTGQTATGMSDSALSNQIMQRIQGGHRDRLPGDHQREECACHRERHRQHDHQ